MLDEPTLLIVTTDDDLFDNPPQGSVVVTPGHEPEPTD